MSCCTKFSALWDSLPYSSPSTPDCSGPVLGGERFRGGGAGSIPGRSGRPGVPSFRRCLAEPLHSGSVKYRDSRSAIALTITLPGPWPWTNEKKNELQYLNELKHPRSVKFVYIASKPVHT